MVWACRVWVCPGWAWGLPGLTLPGLGLGLPGLTLPGLGLGLPGLTLPGLGLGLPGLTLPGLTVGLGGLTLPGLGLGLPGLTLPGLGLGLPGLTLPGLGLTLPGVSPILVPGLPPITVPGLPPLLVNLPGLQAMENAFNTAVLNSELNFNASVVGTETALETAIFGGTGAVGGVIDNFFNGFNAVLGTGEATFNSLLGVPFPTGYLAANLVVGAPNVAIGGGALGGLLGAVDTKFLWDLGVVGAPTALTTNVSTTIPTLGAALVGVPIAGLQGIAAGQLGFLNNMVAAETNFDANLLNSELAWEAGTFGPNAFNGALNRMFNVYNLTLLTGEQTANSLLGGTQVPALNAGLFLTGGGTGVFNTNGGIGGLEGIFDQFLAAEVALGV